MAESRYYLVPDYYPAFACKMGRCRACCCVGWPVSLSLQDYYHLLGIACKKALRARLDCALKPLPNPTEEKYAELAHQGNGDCPLRLADGRCAVHAELGEKSLPLICRLYPRAVRGEGNDECSCANSCEAVVELLMRQESPLSFIRHAMAFDLPRQPERTVFYESVAREQEIRLYLIRILQERALPIPARLAKLWQAMQVFEAPLRNRDASAVDRLLRQPAQPFSIPREADPLKADTPEALSAPLGVVRNMLFTLARNNPTLLAYSQTAIARLGDGTPETWRQAAARFETAFPQWRTLFEHLLVNHMFFIRFPFVELRWNFREQFVTLCAVYALLRYLAVGCATDGPEDAALADVIAAAFRMIDHTPFHSYAVPLLRGLGCDSPENALQLTVL